MAFHRKSRNSRWLSALAIAALMTGAGCSDEEEEQPTTGEGTLFAQGCPAPGTTKAWQMQDEGLIMTGPDALGREGDFVLMNEKAAFVISGTTHLNTYYYYPGIVVDAVALNGCEQASPERFEELAFLVGRLNIRSFGESVLRAFHGDSVTIVNDGADGNAAIVRVTAFDDRHQLVEAELLRTAFRDGNPQHPSQPLGLQATLDYILEPNSNALKIRATIKNTKSTAQQIFPANIFLFGDTTEVGYYAGSELPVGDFNAKIAVPWLVARGTDSAWAYSINNSIMGTLNIQGVDAAFDSRYALIPAQLQPAGQPSDSLTYETYLGVSGTDGNDAVSGFREKITLSGDSGEPDYDVSGAVITEGTREPVAGVEVELQTKGANNQWRPVEFFRTDAEGKYSGKATNIGIRDQEYRLVAKVPGRSDVTPQTVTFPSTTAVEFLVPTAAKLECHVADQAGVAIPAKVLLWKDGAVAHRLYPTKFGQSFPVQPGTYEVSITRGFEYTPLKQTITIPASQTTPLRVTLRQVVDTTGYLSMDGHVHGGPSPDSPVIPADRIVTVAAEGIEVAISSDHEYIGSWEKAAPDPDLTPWVRTVAGAEVTANNPEHINAYPFPLRDGKINRGDFVNWYGMDIAEIFATIRARGAQVISLNHPRLSCNYSCLVNYDRLTGAATLADPTTIGLPADAQLWSWDFDTFEYQNGNNVVFAGDQPPSKRNDPDADPNATGLFDDWMSYHNLGKTVTAVGVTDTHYYELGSPLNYFLSSTDEPREFKDDQLVQAMLNGRSLVSTGAFADVRVNNTARLGDTITDTDGSVQLQVKIQALPEIDVKFFKVFVNCDQLPDFPTQDPYGVVKFDGTITVPVNRDAHIVVLGFGEDNLPLGMEQFDSVGVPRFTTNPIFVDFDGNGRFDAPGGKTCSYTSPLQEAAPAPRRPELQRPELVEPKSGDGCKAPTFVTQATK